MEPLVSLTLSMYSNSGVYALLLGSGVSRAAGIPTGWEVVLELIRRIAVAAKEDCGDDPERWYTERFGEPPTYSGLLDKLTASAGERQRLLQAFFEATPEERENGEKTPTAGHRAIASLVARGYIRVILTTNFDRLMERALEEHGVAAVVIDSPERAEGAPPFAHTQCTLVKIHGDYLDLRFRNTPAELAEYDPRFNRLLARVFNEYGLLISGWSGDWDVALRAALERTESRRYGLHWTTPDAVLNERARQLTEFFGGRAVTGVTADKLFTELAERITALEERAAASPESVQVAVARAKRYLADPVHRIRLDDLVGDAVSSVRDELDQRFTHGQAPGDLDARLAEQIAPLDGLSETVVALGFEGGRWAEPWNYAIWVRGVERLASVPAPQRGALAVWPALRFYPAQLLFYGLGLTATQAENWGLLKALFERPRIRTPRGPETTCERLNNWSVLDTNLAQQLRPPGQGLYYTPQSDHLNDLLWPVLARHSPTREAYDEGFDDFEMLVALQRLHESNAPDGGRPWMPPGRYVWRNEGERFLAAARELGAEWPPVAAGMFDGDGGRLTALLEIFETLNNRWRQRMY